MMTRACSIVIASLLALPLASCQKQQPVASVPDGGRICLTVGADEIELESKAAVESVPATLAWMVTTGSASSETSVRSVLSASVVDNVIQTSLYQTNPATAYNWYVANSALTLSGGAVTMDVLNPALSDDFVCGSARANTTVTPSVTLNHILARTGAVSVVPASVLYTVKSVSSVTLRSVTGGHSGTYNVTTGSWTSKTGAVNENLVSDLFLVPGTYQVYVTYTLARGNWEREYTRHGSVTLTGGRINDITVKANGGDGVSSVTITVSLEPWTRTSADLQL